MDSFKQTFFWRLTSVIFFYLITSSSVWALGTERLASRVAESIRQLSGAHYQTVAISRIKQKDQNQVIRNSMS